MIVFPTFTDTNFSPLTGKLCPLSLLWHIVAENVFLNTDSHGNITKGYRRNVYSVWICCQSNFRPWTCQLLLLGMMLLTDFLVFLKTFTLRLRWYCHCACDVRKVCEYVCLTVILLTCMLGLLFQAYHPECRHHVTHDHAKQKPHKHTSCPFCFLKSVNSVLPVLTKIKNSNNNAGRISAFESIIPQGAYLCCFLRLLWKSSFFSPFFKT